VLPVDLLKASLFYGETKQLLVFVHMNNQCPLMAQNDQFGLTARDD